MSIVICTYNRCQSLQETLDSLRSQRVAEGLALEIWVVDNNSVDVTQELATQIARGFPWPVRYVREKSQGIGYARNRGLQVAQGDYIAFIDDDALAAEEWAGQLFRCFEETGADMVGGKVAPLWTAPRPAWLSQDLMGPVMSVDQGSLRKLCQWPQEYFLTTNCAVRRLSVGRYGMFDPALGRRAHRWIGGEDSELFERWLRRGARIFYEPAALVHHKVGQERVTPDFFRRWFEDIGLTQAHQLPWKWHYRLSLIPLWRWKKLLGAWFRYFVARAAGSNEAVRLRAELWWRFERGFLQERLDHWRSQWRGVAQPKCRFAKA